MVNNKENSTAVASAAVIRAGAASVEAESSFIGVGCLVLPAAKPAPYNWSRVVSGAAVVPAGFDYIRRRKIPATLITARPYVKYSKPVTIR